MSDALGRAGEVWIGGTVGAMFYCDMTLVLVIAALWLMSGVVFCLALCAAAHRAIPGPESGAEDCSGPSDPTGMPERERPRLADAA